MSQPKSTVTEIVVPDPTHPPIDITLVPYTPEWARDFQRERQRLIDAFAGDAECRQKVQRMFAESIAHIGSTSIPGAVAKPYIDIYCYYSNSDFFLANFLQRHGYTWYSACGSRWNGYLYKSSQGESSTCKGYFLHLRETDFLVSFAEKLRSDASLVQRYNEAKRRIVADHPRISFPEYTMLKSMFIKSSFSMEDWLRCFCNDDYYSSPTPPPLYELVRFILSAAAGHAPSTQPLLFAPNEVFTIQSSAYACGGGVQIFTPLGLAVVLAIEPRLNMNINMINLSGSSIAERMQRLARFAPAISRLRQHGCTSASFLSWSIGARSRAEDVQTMHSALVGGADFGGISPIAVPGFAQPCHSRDRGYWDREENHKTPAEILAPLFTALPDAVPVLEAVKKCFLHGNIREPRASALCLLELSNFGPSATALFNGITCISRALESLQLLLHLAVFIKENVTDDVVCALSTDDLRALGLGIGDARRFNIAVLKEQAESHGKSASPAAAGAVPASIDDPYALFVAAYDASLAPQYPDQLLAAVRETTFAFCRKFRVGEAEAVRYFKEIQAEAVGHKDELLDSIAESAVLIWTSAKRLTLAAGTAIEFCSLLNRILREHDPDLLPSACVVVRGINLLCVMRRDESKLLYPPGGESHRGGGLPLQHVPFFAPGKKFRVPMFLATSFKVDVAFKYSARLSLDRPRRSSHAVAPGSGSWRSTPACPPCTGLFAWIPKGRRR
jgi:GrpB-like predicted nucleotidyltransferase (UPF0157 family)